MAGSRSWRRGRSLLGLTCLGLSCLALSCLGLGACSGGPRGGGPARIRFWHSMAGEKGNELRAIVERFNSLPENRGRREVELQFIGNYEEGLTKLRTSLMGGRGPHVVQVNEIGTQLMMDSGVITPLDHFARADPGFPRDKLLPQIARYYEVGGTLHSLPFATSTPVLYYNVGALAKAGIPRPPATFQELERDARLLSRPESRVTGITWPVYGWFFEEFLAREGVPLANHDNGRSGRATEVNYAAPAGVAFLSLWARMVRAGVFLNVGRSWDAAEQSFLAGRTAMLITSTGDVFEILRQASFKVGTAPLPTESRVHAAGGGVIVGGNSLWILNCNPPSEQRDAYLFLRYMASREVQKEWHDRTGYFPIRSDVIDELVREGFYSRYPAAWTAIEQLRASPDVPATRGALLGSFPEAREQEADAIEEAISGQLDARAALLRAKAETEQSLRRYNRGRK